MCTLMSKLESATAQEFQQAWRQWPVPQNRTKFDVTFMELYFTSLTAQVGDKGPLLKVSITFFGNFTCR